MKASGNHHQSYGRRELNKEIINFKYGNFYFTNSISKPKSNRYQYLKAQHGSSYALVNFRNLRPILHLGQMFHCKHGK